MRVKIRARVGLWWRRKPISRLGLLLGRDRVDRLGDLVDRHGDFADLDAHGVAQGVAHGFEDAARHGGREQQVLALLGQLADDALHVGPEAHVEHAVGFVEHDDLDLGEGEVAALDHVEQAARRGDDEVDAAAHRFHLRLVGHAAVDGYDVLAGVLAAGASDFVDLGAELARGGDHEGAHALAAPEALQDGQHEGGRLAGAGLGAADDVAAVDDLGDGLFLDGGRRVVTERVDGVEHGAAKTELGETGGRHECH